MSNKLKDRERKMNVVFSNSYGTPNVGDEALVTSLCCNLSSAISQDQKIDILTRFPAFTAERHPHCRAVRSSVLQGSLGTIRSIRRACVLVVGPGGLIQDASSIWNLLFHMSRVAIAVVFRVPVLGCGLGIGPITTRLGKIVASLGLRRFHHIVVRDAASAACAKSLGVCESKITLASDMALLLPSDSGESHCPLRQALLASQKEGRLIVGISLRPEPGKHRSSNSLSLLLEIYIQQITLAINSLAKSANLHVVFFSMHPEQDDHLGVLLQGRLNSTIKFTLVPGTTHPQDALQLLAIPKLIIAMRLHAVILAARSLVPVISICYDPKVFEFAASAGLGEWCLSSSDVNASRLSRMINHVLLHRPEIQVNLKSSIQHLACLSEKNLRILVETIRNGARNV